LRAVTKHRAQEILCLRWPAKFNYRILLHGWRDSLCGLLKTIFDNRIPAGHAAFLNSSPYTRFGYSSANSPEKIWRYAQRAHFHATGIAAFSIGLLLLVSASSLKQRFKAITAVFIGLGGLYPLAWLTMFIIAPSIGRDAAHAHPVTELLTYIGVGGLLLGIAILLANLFLGLFGEPNDT
jgi:hypothetical protein